MKMARPLACAALAALVPTAAFAATCDSLASLEWLVGEWRAEGRKSTFHETWARVSPSSFEGAGIERAAPDGKARGSESLRLAAMAGGVYYVSKVSHNPLPVAFRLTECADGRFVFENPEHDFPRRLEYLRRDAGGLTVTVGEGEGAFTLEFARVPEAPAPADAVLAAEDARFAAMMAADPAEMSRWLAVDLAYVHSTGDVHGRDQLIESITSGATRYVSIVPGERRVTFFDEAAALVRGTASLKVSAGAQPLEFEAAYLAMYVLVDGAWQLHAWQSLRLP